VNKKVVEVEVNGDGGHDVVGFSTPDHAIDVKEDHCGKK